MRPTLWLLPVSLLLLGCGSGSSYVPVSGVITLDGSPASGLNINTQPISTAAHPNPGSGSYGKTDAQGRYSLEVVEPITPGAIAGEHRVTITRIGSTEHRATDEMVREAYWPKRYADGSLRLTVPAEGTNGANFDLTSDGK